MNQKKAKALRKVASILFAVNPVAARACYSRMKRDGVRQPEQCRSKLGAAARELLDKHREDKLNPGRA